MDAAENRPFEAGPLVVAERRNVKSAVTVDNHERSRDFLTQSEMDALLLAAKKGRFGTRDYSMFLLAFRHGLRASELIGLRKSDIDLEAGRIWVNRKKRGLSTSQPLSGDEIRGLKGYLKTRYDDLPWIFLSSQGTAMSRQNFHYLVVECGHRAGLGEIHPHMLRHSCGHVLADKGMDTRLLQDWLGHRDIRHTAWYSRTSAARFEGVWGGR
jgi:integrase